MYLNILFLIFIFLYVIITDINFLIFLYVIINVLILIISLEGLISNTYILYLK